MSTTFPQTETVSPAPIPETFSPLRQAGDFARDMAIRVQTTLASYRYEVNERWSELSSWQRVVYRIGSVATTGFGMWAAYQSLRMTGAIAHEVSDGELWGAAAHSASIPDETSVADSYSPAAPVVEDSLAMHADFEQAVANGRQRAPDRDYDFVLPAATSKAPESLPLGDYEPASGHGTIWNQTIAYADELGYGDLTESEKRRVTGRILDFNSLTWGEARRLPDSYEPRMPTQRVMEGWLDQVGADKTHAADRTAPPPPSPEPDAPPQDDAPFSEQPPAEAGCNRPDWITWIPWLDCERNAKDVWLAAIAGLVVVAAGGQRALNRGRQRRAAAAANRRVAEGGDGRVITDDERQAAEREDARRRRAQESTHV